MDFGFTPEQGKLKKEICDFLTREVTEDFLKGIDEEGQGELSLSFSRRLARNGWPGLAIAKEYGGMGGSYVDFCIFEEEMGLHNAPYDDIYPAIRDVATGLLLFGSEEQKKKYIPAIIAVEDLWCLGYTEPEAGSDLASLSTRAIRNGDDYIINGQKTFTSFAHRAQFCWLMARTDPGLPKHKGISIFILDMRAPGVMRRDLPVMGVSRVSELFFDNVCVPKENLVGEENRGFYQAAHTLAAHRAGMDRVMGRQGGWRTFREIVRFAKEPRHGGKPLSKDPVVRQKIAELAIEFEVARLLAYRGAWAQDRGISPTNEGAVSKIFATEMQRRVAGFGMEIMGLYGQLARGSKYLPLAGNVEAAFRDTVAYTFAGGSNEIQRNIIATRGFRLPA
ncbi:MAG: acyl-CoA dehydrogenase family protein [Chloroflexi bacterium]|nr:acyl-CoA dehydrogenase family protein [Chloroflexota bacterium]